MIAPAPRRGEVFHQLHRPLDVCEQRRDGLALAVDRRRRITRRDGPMPPECEVGEESSRAVRCPKGKSHPRGVRMPIIDGKNVSPDHAIHQGLCPECAAKLDYKTALSHAQGHWGMDPNSPRLS